MDSKLYFAPLPPRAIGDQRLKGLHLRVLAAVALHDRMSGSRKGGQGCWAGNQKLAAECGCNYNNLSTTITELAEFGYITRDPHPLNKRLRVYRVVYNEADQAFVKAKDSSPTGEVLSDRDVTRDAGTLRSETNEALKIVRPDFENIPQEQGVEGVEYIPQKREDIPLKGEINSSEDAPPKGGALLPDDNVTNLGAKLATFERELKAGRIETSDLKAWGDFLSDLHLGGNLDDPNAQRADRLVDDVWVELERRGAA